jgi:hypothetical protein
MNAPVRCQACGKLNLAINKQCKKCGGDLAGSRPAKTSVALSACLYTGTMCQHPCAMAKVENRASHPAQCIRSAVQESDPQ